MEEVVKRKKVGFAALSFEEKQEMGSKGGRAAWEKGVAHRWTKEKAREAGRKGGMASRGGRGRAPDPEEGFAVPRSGLA